MFLMSNDRGAPQRLIFDVADLIPIPEAPSDQKLEGTFAWSFYDSLPDEVRERRLRHYDEIDSPRARLSAERQLVLKQVSSIAKLADMVVAVREKNRHQAASVLPTLRLQRGALTSLLHPALPAEERLLCGGDLPDDSVPLSVLLHPGPDRARRYGMVEDKLLPFKSGKLYGGDPKTFFALAAQLKIAMYFNLRLDPNQWRPWLATKGPILTRLDVDATWDNADQTGGNLDVYQAATARGGHAVALVGYTADRFIVRNSWGTGWGDKGFGYASLPYAKAAFTEAYGVSV